VGRFRRTPQRFENSTAGKRFVAAHDAGANVFAGERIKVEREKSGWMVKRRDGTSVNVPSPLLW
jgi:hypothetical protein